ncbi:MAG: serine/threonine-protein kinase [Myxococcota bacterium]
MSADPADPTRILDDEIAGLDEPRIEDTPTKILPEDSSQRIEDTPTKVMPDAAARIEETPTKILSDAPLVEDDSEAATVLVQAAAQVEVPIEADEAATALMDREEEDLTVVSEPPAAPTRVSAEPAPAAAASARPDGPVKTRVIDELAEQGPMDAPTDLAIGLAAAEAAPRTAPAAVTDAMTQRAAAPVAKTRGNLTGTRLLNRYRIGDQLGVGGFGTVYKAIDELKMAGGESAEIAIKVMDAEVVQGRLDVLVQEVARSHHVSHPNILRVYDIHRDADLAFITMEMLDGVELADMIQERSAATGAQAAGKSKGQGKAPATLLPLGDVDRVAQDVCRALAHCHQHKMVHADIKPANIFVCKDGTVKVLDLGIAQIMGSRGSVSGYSALYASPQQIEGEASDPRDDVFSIACSLYLCLAGEHPFDAKSSKEARAAGEKIDLTKLPRRYRKALGAALAWKREDRTASAALLWKQVSPAVRRRNAVFAGLAATAVAGIAAASMIGQSIGEESIAVSGANQAKAEDAYRRAMNDQSSGANSGREGLLEAMQANPYHDEAAAAYVNLIESTPFNDPAEYSLVWADFGFALDAAPTSDALQAAAKERIDGLLSADPSALPRSRVLSEYRAPLCVLPQAGYRVEEIEALRLALDIRC